ncbi:hypothetical protein G6F70_000351 [Rhizopus microsporus]|uniref:Uncharacterized protein n=2 Tax=Rhizopus TaxID=4842 RepID=A0A367JCK0_RHIAZ|nr:hypothetical protein G6F71_004128 [Rhizopus microsporus]RCH87668.1 hypothetical protein CU097_009516 [Rhizopus azygosporus]KAG1204613.1 hypothetical protein G6F70_000351 [Rhizopus microsporus]KAG1212017.1 hypothetical protein G6F69_004079 [Rhizopus microsporus]KAG1235077.1 hypothetical protein G6F67_003041 [Rhizopus microsporus]
MKAAIQNAQTNQRDFKRKLDELPLNLSSTTTISTRPSVLSSTAASTTPRVSSTIMSPPPNAPSVSLYQRNMTFVLEFKAARIKQAKEFMDWRACMVEGCKIGCY